MTPAERINNAIADGLTVYVATYGRIVKINKRFKGAKHWLDLGFEFFRMSENGSLLMIDGYKDVNTPKWSNASGAKITAQ